MEQKILEMCIWRNFQPKKGGGSPGGLHLQVRLARDREHLFLSLTGWLQLGHLK